MEGFLQEGHLIELDFEKENGEVLKFKSLVENVSSADMLSIYAPMLKGTTYPLAVGDQLKIYYSKLNRFSGKYDIYSFNAEVISRIRKENIAMLRIKRLTEIFLVQRRDTYRLSFVKKMALSLETDQKETTIEILSKDISVGGLRGVVSQPLAVGHEIMCHLFLTDYEKMDIHGFVLSSELMEDSRMKYDVRIQFHRVDPSHMKRLVSFINKAQADMIKKVATGRHELLMRQTLGDSKLYPNSKRENADIILNWINYSPFLLWILFVGSLLMFLSGVPATEYPLQRFFNFVYRRGWNFELLTNSIYLMGFTMLLSIISIGLNRLRLKRDYDYFRSTFYVVSILCLLMIVITSVLIATQG